MWQPMHGLGSFAWAGATASLVDFFELDRAGAEDARSVGHDGVRIAQKAGLNPELVAVEATGPVWKAILEIAHRHDAAAIVMGSRGLMCLHSLMLGSGSSAVVHHASRPTLVIHRPATTTLTRTEHSAAHEERSRCGARHNGGSHRPPTIIPRYCSRSWRILVS